MLWENGKRKISMDVFVINAQEAACRFGASEEHGLEESPLKGWTTIVTDPRSTRKSKKFEQEGV